MPQVSYKRHLWTAVLLTWSLAGCSGGSGVKLVPVEGVVTLDGKPVGDAEVLFRPAGGRPSGGRTDPEGHYSLSYTREEKGALIGEHQVTISTYLEADDESPDPVRQKGRVESIPQKYNKRTTLKVEVQPDDVVIADFSLESK